MILRLFAVKYFNGKKTCKTSLLKTLKASFFLNMVLFSKNFVNNFARTIAGIIKSNL